MLLVAAVQQSESLCMCTYPLSLLDSFLYRPPQSIEQSPLCYTVAVYYLYVYVCMYIYIYVYIYICVCVCVYVIPNFPIYPSPNLSPDNHIFVFYICDYPSIS